LKFPLHIAELEERRTLKTNKINPDYSKFSFKTRQCPSKLQLNMLLILPTYNSNLPDDVLSIDLIWGLIRILGQKAKSSLIKVSCVSLFLNFR